MNEAYILKGILIGLSIAAPVGPIGLLCIQRTLTQGKAVGLVSGLGAATADALYGTIAALGLTALSHFLLGQQQLLHLVGGVFLAYLGIKTLRSTAASSPAKVGGANMWMAYTSVLLLTITNPMTILSFLGIFSGVGVSATHGAQLDALWLVGGVFAGSLLWWFFLTSIVGMVQNRLPSLTWINRLSGVILIGFSIWSLGHFM
ncbi:LysE family translocator [Priestia koreensis]|uniref:LysE family translocator n=1 Tax=Priestia koreensis TaxID=284581 RepID=UPI0034596ED2